MEVVVIVGSLPAIVVARCGVDFSPVDLPLAAQFCKCIGVAHHVDLNVFGQYDVAILERDMEGDVVVSVVAVVSIRSGGLTSIGLDTD